MTITPPDVARAGTPIARIARVAARAVCAAMLVAGTASVSASPWSLLSPADGSLVTVAGHPKRDGHYYASSIVSAVDGTSVQPWVSLDAGLKWRRAVPLDVDPSTRAAGTILAGGTPTRLYLEAGDRLLRSDDEGTTWIDLELGAPSTPPPRLLGVNPLNGTEVIVLAGGLPQRSTDAGASWTPLPAFAAAIGSVDWFARIVYLVSATQTRSYAIEGGALVGSANFAPRAIQTEGNLGLAITAGSVYRSTNNGVTWTVTLNDAGQVDFGGIAFAPSVSGFAYVWERAGSGRVWRTTDRGANWVQVASAPCRCDWTGIAVSVGDANLFVATTTAGAYASQDGGLTYTTLLQNSGLPGAPALQVLSDAGDRKSKWLATDVRRLRPLVSGNEGATWSTVNAAPDGDIVRPAFLHPDISGLLFGPGTPRAGGTTLWRSVDSGGVWKSALVFGDGTDEALVNLVPGPAPFDMIAVLRLSGAAGAIAQVYRSTNEGADWTLRTPPPGLEPHAAVRTSAGLFVAGRPASKATDSSLWRSTDEGATWTAIDVLPGTALRITALGRARSVAARLYAGTDAGGADALWRSNDGGLTWARAARAIGSEPVTSITVHPTLADQVVIAQGIDGVFRSTDGGATWKALDAGLLDRNVQGVSYDASDARYLYASGAGGAFRADLAEAPPAAIARSVEYFYPPFGHYFVTANPDEIDGLDRGIIVGWERTGERPPVEAPDAQQRKPVCRFFGVGFAPRSSHFYTPYPNECDIVKADPNWVYENIAFAWRLPDGEGRCEIGQRPLYRFFNAFASGAPNHRYTTNLRVADAMRAAGWIPEGDGRTYAFACVPL